MRAALLLLAILIFQAHGEAQTIALEKSWQFRRLGAKRWYPAEVPGTVHTDLMHNGLLPDPFIGSNEKTVQWVEKQFWEYRLLFAYPEKLRHCYGAALQFDGIDTYADVYLNGQLLFHADNMFRRWEIPALGRLRANNELRIVFKPAARIADSLRRKVSLQYPEGERPFVRKAQYQFGWDWGPRLLTCGLWKGVRLCGFGKDLIDHDDPDGFHSAPSKAHNVVLHTEPDAQGAAFYFEIDGKPVYMKGANWIPGDSFLPRAKKRRYYEQQLIAAKEAGLNMLRVWGGGVYEDDRFYELCDSLGIYVWQDFMFAGALYPADILFLDNVAQEVRQQVQRLRRHPCIVLWCGNNEIEEAWFNWGWQKQFGYSATDSARLWNDYKKIFHELIPSILKQEDPARPYWPSSPSLGWGRDSAYKKGDVHYWGVWWGKEAVSRYQQKIGRFMSEYGMQGMPDMRSIRAFAGSGPLDTSNAALRVHQKHPFGYQNINMYIEQKFPVPKRFEDLVYVSQLMQADAIGIAIDAHRAAAPYNMGTLFWQWNDCWPVTSWSAVDWYGRKKALYYEVKRAFAPLRIKAWIGPGPILKTEVLGAEGLNARYFYTTRQYSAGNPSLGEGSGPIYFDSAYHVKPVLESYWESGTSTDTSSYVFLFSLKDSTGKTVAERVSFWMDQKHRSLPVPNFQVTVTSDFIEIVSDLPATAVELQVPDGTWLDDNYFDLFPGHPHRIPYRSPLPLVQFKKSLRIRSLADVLPR
jgi:beta-mannosidase